MRHVVAEEGSQVQARSAQRLGWKMNKSWRALQGRGKPLPPLQGSNLLDNPKPGAALRLPWLPYSAPSALSKGSAEERKDGTDDLINWNKESNSEQVRNDFSNWFRWSATSYWLAAPRAPFTFKGLALSGCWR